jgi:predicted permease
MSFLDAFRHRLRSALRPSAEQRARDDEFAFHLSMAERDANNDAGAARREFGNRTYLSEEVRWMGATRWIDSIRQDVRYGLRALRRSPVFTLVAVLSVGLGVGANTAVFGMIHTILLAELPVPRPRELVMLRRDVQYGTFFNWSEYQAVARAPGVAVTGMTTWYSDSTIISGSLVPVDHVDLVAGNFHQVLGLTPAAGRFLTPADESGALTVAVVTFALATRYFASPEASLGQTIRLQGVPFTIVGVAPRGYSGLMLLQPAQVVVPRTSGARIHPLDDPPPVMIVARVPRGEKAKGAAIVGTYRSCCADAQLTGGSSYGPRPKPTDRVELVDVSRGITATGKGDVRADFSGTLYALMGGVAVLLLIACTNVGNLLLARAVVRSRELAVRLSLGASRARIVRQLLVESSLLAVLGAIVGILVAVLGTSLLARNLPANLRILQEFVAVRPNPVILGFTAAVAIACVLLFGALPAFRATRFDLIAQLRDAPTASRFSRLDRALVAVQVGLALVLASVAGLFVATLHNLASGTSTLDPERLLIAEIQMSPESWERLPLRSLYQQLGEQLRHVPGVRQVTMTNLVPLLFMGGTTRVLDAPGFESVPNEDMWTGVATVTPGFFETMSITILGRDFTADDTRGSEAVAVISERLATEFFAGRDPIGQMLRFRGGSGRGPSFRIIGVAEDVKYFDLRARPPRELYVPWSQSDDREFSGQPIFVMRTDQRADKLVGTVTNVITTRFPEVGIRRLRSMTANASLVLGREQAMVALSITFGTLALSLTAIGLYGVLAFHVSSRRREIGVRIALGAEAYRVVAMVLRQSLVVILVGTLLGVPLSLAASRSLTALLYGIPAWHPAPLLVAALVLVTVGVLASFLPSRSAARVDPLVAMKAE